MPPANRFAHGTRARYVAGCRCAPCTTANREYARGRALALVRGGWNGLVSSEKARTHLLELRRAGIGRRAVAASCDVALSIIAGIASGERRQIRAATERKILAVDAGARSDASLVPAKATWAAVKRLRKLGLPKAEIARRMGSKTPALQLRARLVLARSEAAVLRILREEQRKRAVCRCGLSHADDPTAAEYCARNVVGPEDFAGTAA